MEIKFETQRAFETAVNNALCIDDDVFQMIGVEISELEKKIVSLEKKISQLEAESYEAY